jgi:vacuole morphology and inheritance protein 14
MNSDEVEVTASFLIQVHLFVNLLETPLFLGMCLISHFYFLRFIDIRLRLLEPSEHPHLLKIMYGLLMVLPQNDAFHSLLQRLEKGTAITLFNHQIAQFDSEGNPVPPQPIVPK